MCVSWVLDMILEELDVTCRERTKDSIFFLLGNLGFIAISQLYASIL